MIAKLKGVVDAIADDNCIIDVNGVGYLVFASSKTLAKLEKNTAATLYIETVVREDSITLYGFLDNVEKNCFTILTKVQGVGSKVGLAILSALAPMQISQAIMAQDKDSFTMANGVGPKLAARIVVELKDKPISLAGGDSVANFETMNYEDDVKARVSDPSQMEDAISALVNLGYQRLEAYRVVNWVLKNDANAGTPALIRMALKELAGKDK